MTLLLVAVGAALGAPLRFFTDRAVQARIGSAFPWGTLAVNVTGSLVLGIVTGGTALGALPASALATVGAGLCGSFTTYSAFAYQTVQLTSEGAGRTAVVYACLSVSAGIAAAWTGWQLADAIWA
ncbi:MAG: fluoride efflux transporter CrcB [Actinomycetota bacterium]|nr:fluoride efflux transporter CrcB [Actinomycetota bacterium]